MRNYKWISAFAMTAMMFAGTAAFSQGHGKGHGNGKGNGHFKDKQKDKDYEDDDDRRGYGYSTQDRDEIRQWYGERGGHLPPGLAKKDRLPPGLERQLVTRGSLPPGLQQRMYPVPVEIERRLPPPPPDCERVVIGGHFVLLNRRTNIVVDIFHLE